MTTATAPRPLTPEVSAWADVLADYPPRSLKRRRAVDDLLLRSLHLADHHPTDVPEEGSR